MFDCQCGVLGLVDLKANRKLAKKKKEKKEENQKNIHTHFPNLTLKDGQQKNVLWIPPYLIFSVIIADMVEKGHDLDGPNFEQDTVYSFHSVFDKIETGSRNLTVLAGWKHTWRNDGSKGGIGEDHDLVIIDGNRHIIVNFEMKYTISKNGSFQKAMDQLNNQQKYFEEFHHELQLGGWSFINVLVYKENVDVKLCPNCQSFTLNKEKMKPQNLHNWWDKLGDKISPGTNTTKMSYEEVVERFVGPCTKVSDFVCNERQIRDKEHKTLTGSNDIVSAGIFTGTLKDSKQMKASAEAAKNQLTDQEKEILKNSKRVLLTGDYGTGKTYYLVEKVKKLVEMAQKDQKADELAKKSQEDQKGKELAENTQEDQKVKEVAKKTKEAQNAKVLAEKTKKDGKVNILFVVGNILTNHTLLEDQNEPLEGAVVLNTKLDKEFENLKNNANIEICHLGNKFYVDPTNPQEKEQTVCLDKLENYLKQGYHLFFDEIANKTEFCSVFLALLDLVYLSNKYPVQTMWIAMRPDSYFKNPGFDEVKLKTNFRNSPKIIAGVNGLFETYQIKPVSHQKRAESVFVSLDKPRVDGGSPKLLIGQRCGLWDQPELLKGVFEPHKDEIGIHEFIRLMCKHNDPDYLYHPHELLKRALNSKKDNPYIGTQNFERLIKYLEQEVIGLQNQAIELIKRALESYRGDNVFLVGLTKSESLISKEILEQQNPEFDFKPLWEYNKVPLKPSCFFHFSDRTDIMFHDIWNGIEVKNLVVYVGCKLHSKSDFEILEILRSLMLRASVSLTVIICQEQGRNQNRFWQHGMKLFFNNVKIKKKDIFPEIYDSLMNGYKQLQENPIEGVIAVPHKYNILVWDAIIVGFNDIEGGIFPVRIDFEENRPPVVKFYSKISYHAQMDIDGAIWLDKENWFNIQVILATIQKWLGYGPNLLPSVCVPPTFRLCFCTYVPLFKSGSLPMSVSLSVYPSCCPSILLSSHMPYFMPVQSSSPYIGQPANVTYCQSVCVPVCMPARLTLCPSVCLSVHPSESI
jgi:ubiquitin-protein ligase